jgi:acyl-CoA thioesterase FadM
MQGRVLNAHWMTYFDEASFEFVGSLGESISTSELIHSVLVKSTIEWQGSPTYRDEIGISV